MRALLGMALTGGGLTLLWLGRSASTSFASDITRLFSGSPTRTSVLLLTAGGAALAAGVWILATEQFPRLPRRGRRRRRRPGRR